MAKIAVAPLVGAWIEMKIPEITTFHCRVAPLVGAWIEIVDSVLRNKIVVGRSPRGSVD